MRYLLRMGASVSGVKHHAASLALLVETRGHLLPLVRDDPAATTEAGRGLPLARPRRSVIAYTVGWESGDLAVLDLRRHRRTMFVGHAGLPKRSVGSGWASGDTDACPFIIR